MGGVGARRSRALWHCAAGLHAVQTAATAAAIEVTVAHDILSRQYLCHSFTIQIERIPTTRPAVRRRRRRSLWYDF